MNLVNHVKARTRSIQFDKGPIVSLSDHLGSPGSHPRPSKRTSSLAVSEDIGSSRSAFHDPRGPIRRYKSMLEVETPPSIKPVEPMSFDELYASPITASQPQGMDHHKGRQTMESSTGTTTDRSRQELEDTNSLICPLHLLTAPSIFTHSK